MRLKMYLAEAVIWIVACILFILPFVWGYHKIVPPVSTPSAIYYTNTVTP